MKNKIDGKFIKQEFIPPSTECVTAREEKRRLHRLMNPRNPGLPEDGDNSTGSYRGFLTNIRKGRAANKKLILCMQQGIGIQPRKAKTLRKLHPKTLGKKTHKNLQKTKLSIFQQNRIVMVNHGWKPNVPVVRRSIKRQQLREIIKMGKEKYGRCADRRHEKTGGKYKRIKQVA
jgi:hypothetical protein